MSIEVCLLEGQFPSWPVGKSESLYWELPAPDGKEGTLREQNTFILERYCTTVVRTTRELHLDSVSISVRVGVHTVVRPLLSLVYSSCLPPLRRQHRKRLYVPRMPPRPKVRVLRDIKARQGVADNEISRRAYLYVARNQSLPAQVRYQAQLQLNAFGRYTRPTTVKNRCTATGRGRGVIGEFGLCRVRE